MVKYDVIMLFREKVTNKLNKTIKEIMPFDHPDFGLCLGLPIFEIQAEKELSADDKKKLEKFFMDKSADYFKEAFSDIFVEFEIVGFNIEKKKEQNHE